MRTVFESYAVGLVAYFLPLVPQDLEVQMKADFGQVAATGITTVATVLVWYDSFVFFL